LTATSTPFRYQFTPAQKSVSFVRSLSSRAEMMRSMSSGVRSPGMLLPNETTWTFAGSTP
jgi:hypothetical protein